MDSLAWASLGSLAAANCVVGEVDRALAISRNLTRRRPNEQWARVTRAMMLAFTGDGEGSRAELCEAERLSPKEVGAYAYVSVLAHFVDGLDDEVVALTGRPDVESNWITHTLGFGSA